MQEEVRRFVDEGPTPSGTRASAHCSPRGFHQGLERIGGFGGKADVLASCEVYTGNPACYRQSLAWIESATPADLQRVARRWLTRGDYTLEVLPQGSYKATDASAVDRSKGPPVTTSFPDVAFPDLQRARLTNGIPVIVATRPGVPVARVSLVFNGGYVADLGRKSGTSSFAMSLLDEGAGKLGSLEIADQAERLGADIAAGSSLDSSFASVSALTEQLAPSLALLADVVRRPKFPEPEIERVRKEWIAGIAREKTSPDALAMRVSRPCCMAAAIPMRFRFRARAPTVDHSLAACTTSSSSSSRCCGPTT